jgi:hypothetical protein
MIGWNNPIPGWPLWLFVLVVFIILAVAFGKSR